MVVILLLIIARPWQRKRRSRLCVSELVSSNTADSNATKSKIIEPMVMWWYDNQLLNSKLSVMTRQILLYQESMHELSAQVSGTEVRIINTHLIW